MVPASGGQCLGALFCDGSTRAAGFDNFNRQIWAVDERGVAVTNAYDQIDRVVASAYLPFTSENNMPTDTTSVPSNLTPSTCNWASIYGGFSNQIIRYAYDKIGNVTNLTDWAGTITNAYDALNRNVCSFTTFSSAPSLFYSLLNGFDLADNRTAMTLNAPNETWQTEYSYDSLNRLSTLNNMEAQLDVEYSYNPNGKLASRTGHSEVVNCAYAYDSEQRLQSITVNNSKTLTYAYNNAQQISTIDDRLGTAYDYIYTYDNRDQLTSEETDGPSWYNRGYSYDHARNRINATFNNGSASSFSYTLANKLTNITYGSATANHRYAYDCAGNLTNLISTSATNRFYYNAQNKLGRIEGRGFTNEFRYDSQNRRIGLNHAGIWRYDLHDGMICIGSVTNGTIERFFVRGVGIADGTGDIIAELRREQYGYWSQHYYVANHRGDTVLVYDINQLEEHYARYDAFGNVVEKTGSFTPRYTFSTKEYLSDAKLYLYAYRVYDPIAGRWTQRDPIDYQDSINLYCYCRNNPLNKTDIDGREPITLTTLAIIAVVSVAGGALVGGGVSKACGGSFKQGVTV